MGLYNKAQQLDGSTAWGGGQFAGGQDKNPDDFRIPHPLQEDTLHVVPL